MTWKFPLHPCLRCLVLRAVSMIWPPFCKWQGEQIWLLWIDPKGKEKPGTIYTEACPIHLSSCKPVGQKCLPKLVRIEWTEASIDWMTKEERSWKLSPTLDWSEMWPLKYVIWIIIHCWLCILFCKHINVLILEKNPSIMFCQKYNANCQAT
jgi:hypothetical protein